MVNLAPGQYRLKGHRNGYLDAYYGARRPGRGGTVIVLEAGQELKDLQVKLAPFGVISGTVRDTDGEPMSGAEVVLYRQSYYGDRPSGSPAGGGTHHGRSGPIPGQRPGAGEVFPPCRGEIAQ